MVGDWWKDRLDCRQYGAHFPHVAGIAGQSNRGAQSVVLSGGYEDDQDEGEWFMYTGSGGRDLSGNKRTSKVSLCLKNAVHGTLPVGGATVDTTFSRQPIVYRHSPGPQLMTISLAMTFRHFDWPEPQKGLCITIQ